MQSFNQSPHSEFSPVFMNIGFVSVILLLLWLAGSALLGAFQANIAVRFQEYQDYLPLFAKGYSMVGFILLAVCIACFLAVLVSQFQHARKT